MVEGLITAFLNAKLRRPGISLALYAIASELGSEAIITRMRDRVLRAVTEMLSMAPGVYFRELEFTAFTFNSSIVGETRAFVESGAPQDKLGALNKPLLMMGEAYLTAAGESPGAH